MTYRRDYGKSRLWRSCKTPFRCDGQGSKNPAPLGAGSSILPPPREEGGIDTTKPTVNINSPINTTYYTADQSLQISALDNIGIDTI
jgi:hypothetical protein